MPVDLRSDVLAPPTEAMWAAMRVADLGWPLFNEDQAVAALEAQAAALVGKAAALLLPTCTAANLVALLTLAERGTQVLLEASAHIAVAEAGGLSYVGGLFPRLLPGLDPAAFADVLRDAGAYGGLHTSLVCLEDTHNNAGGAAIGPVTLSSVAEAARAQGIAVHLDGARLFNAAIALGVSARDLAACADMVSLSLSKGLCGPGGALLCGSETHIEIARLTARRIGAASLHKAGWWAAAGRLALTDGVDRLSEDHANATALAAALTAVPGLRVTLPPVPTNMVWVEITAPTISADQFCQRLAAQGFRALARPPHRVRFVLHRGVPAACIPAVAAAAHQALAPSEEFHHDLSPRH